MTSEEMAKDNWIYTYYQGIKNGTYCVGKWIELVYEYLVKGLQEKAFFFDVKKANDAIDWVEHHCFHTEGPLAPHELKLEVWDFAAGALIAEEAGCRVTDAAGLPLTYDRKTSVMAASAGVAQEGYYLPADVLGINVKN